MHVMQKLPVVPICRTSLPLRCRANQNDPLRVPHSPRGAFRDRHGRWARDAMDAMSHETNENIADGEVVWSWRPKAGVKSVERSTGDGDNKARSPGRSRISRNPLRRECRLYRLNLWFCRVLFCCTRTMGAACTRHSLRPRLSREESSCIRSDAERAATAQTAARSYLGGRSGLSRRVRLKSRSQKQTAPCRITTPRTPASRDWQAKTGAV